MSLKLIQQEKGFTLIEIMIALLILAGGLMATAYMQTRSVNDGTTANRLTRRVTGAEDKIEDLYTRTIDDSFFEYKGDLPTTGIIHWDNDTSPYYKISSQALEGDPGLEMLTTIQVKIIPKGEKNDAARERRTVVLNYIRSSRYQ
jgi:prepilin-type N-terminal cleavage/methylation domain-containing protein